MAINQNTIIKIVTNDDVVFRLYLFTPQFSMINFILPILYNFIDGDIEDLSWQDIISNYDDKDIDHQKINEPINLYGINSRTLRYLLEFSKKLYNYKKINPDMDLGQFAYKQLRDYLNQLLTINIKYSIEILQGIFYLDIETGLSKARETWLINLIANRILEQCNYREGDNRCMKMITYTMKIFYLLEIQI